MTEEQPPQKTAAQIAKERCDFKEGTPSEFGEHEEDCPSLHQDAVQCLSCYRIFKGRYRLMLHLEEKPSVLSKEEKRKMKNEGVAEVRKRKNGRANAAQLRRINKELIRLAEISCGQAAKLCPICNFAILRDEKSQQQHAKKCRGRGYG